MTRDEGPNPPRPGVLSDRELWMAIREGWIRATQPIADAQVQPASLDLRLGGEAYQLRASFLPGEETVQARLRQTDSVDDLVIDRISLSPAATLQPRSVYVVPLAESLQLPRTIRGRCNPKSTTGRLDIFTRVITDESERFDEVRAGYHGPLYLEVAPQSFPIRLQAGVCLSQLRLLAGSPALSDQTLRRLYRTTPLLYADNDRPLDLREVTFHEGLCMSIDLSGRLTEGVIGYRAHPHPPVVDLSKLGFYDPSEFWEPIKRPNRDAFILEADRFYILVSKERIRVPPEFAAEMVVYDAGAGEIRTHYAGFFDPGFGFGDGSVLGTKVVMEVRAREVPFMVYDGQTSFKVWFERLCGPPERVYGVGRGSSYQHQALTLSKQFRRPA
ncbi:MAG: 2'-deoxycytidine 5'-triphosphate deaminase [Candidatus Rokuibacteriota bacterium]